jgi:hypothetical protein
MLINISVAHKDARYWNQSWTHANYFFLFFIWARKQIEQTRMLMCHARMQTAKTPQEFLDEEE